MGSKIYISRERKVSPGSFFSEKKAEGVDVTTSANADLQQNRLI
jgi:hypothetical protein